MTNTSKRQQTAQTISFLIPQIIQGAHLGVYTSRSITQTQFLLLVYLHAKGSCTMKDVALHMAVSMPTVTGIVNRLVQANYIKRQNDPRDRRQVVIALTPKAQNFIKGFQKIIAKRWEEVLTILNEEEVEQMLNIVTKLNHVMSAKKL
jgi:DNA-binding MarR family transcriptional regulator